MGTARSPHVYRNPLVAYFSCFLLPLWSEEGVVSMLVATERHQYLTLLKSRRASAYSVDPRRAFLGRSDLTSPINLVDGAAIGFGPA